MVSPALLVVRGWIHGAVASCLAACLNTLHGLTVSRPLKILRSACGFGVLAMIGALCYRVSSHIAVTNQGVEEL